MFHLRYSKKIFRLLISLLSIFYLRDAVQEDNVK